MFIQCGWEGKNNVETCGLYIYIPVYGNTSQKTFLNFPPGTRGTAPLNGASWSNLPNSHGIWSVPGFCLVRPLAGLWQLCLWAGGLLTFLLLYP